MLCMVVFGDAHDNVHHIRHAAGAFCAPVELGVDLGGDDQLPGIRLEQIEHDILDLLRGDHIALADKHGGPIRFSTGAINDPHS